MGWTSVEHYLVLNGSCTAQEDFEVPGVPYKILVDMNGNIVHKGQATIGDLEANINALLAG